MVLVSLQAINAPNPTSPAGTETIAMSGFLEIRKSVETAKEMRVFNVKIRGCVKFMLKVKLKMLMLSIFFAPLLWSDL